MTQVKKVSDVFIRGFKYDLLDIPGKKHHNNSTLWVKKDSDIFNDDVEYIPWVDTESCKDCWDMNYTQTEDLLVFFQKSYKDSFINDV